MLKRFLAIHRHWDNRRNGWRRTVIVMLAAAFTSHLATADLIVNLTNGKRIVVPVENDMIKSIVFSQGKSLPRGRRLKDKRPPILLEDSDPGIGKVLRVGPERKLRYPSDAAKIARKGDIVEIDAGVYHNDHAKWNQSNLTIRGVGGMAHLKSKGRIRNKKGIWIINGDNVTIENIEFSGAAVKHTNGAGIRHQGGNLTIRNCFFHDNEFSILTGNIKTAEVRVESSRFWFQKRKRKFSHGIYIGMVGKFTLTGSHFLGTDRGHQVKTRALENHILYNRIEDAPNGNSSRLIDLPNCGLSFVIGNDLHQAKTTENTNAIGYGSESCPKRTPTQMQLYVVNNTFVNDARSGALVSNDADGDVIVANNLFYGKGRLLSGGGESMNNLQLRRKHIGKEKFSAPKGGGAKDKAKLLAPVHGVVLVPSKEFDLPVGTRDRPQVGALDIGSREASY